MFQSSRGDSRATHASLRDLLHSSIELCTPLIYLDLCWIANAHPLRIFAYGLVTYGRYVCALPVDGVAVASGVDVASGSGVDVGVAVALGSGVLLAVGNGVLPGVADGSGVDVGSGAVTCTGALAVWLLMLLLAVTEIVKVLCSVYVWLMKALLLTTDVEPSPKSHT